MPSDSSTSTKRNSVLHVFVTTTQKIWDWVQRACFRTLRFLNYGLELHLLLAHKLSRLARSDKYRTTLNWTVWCGLSHKAVESNLTVWVSLPVNMVSAKRLQEEKWTIIVRTSILKPTFVLFQWSDCFVCHRSDLSAKRSSVHLFHHHPKKIRGFYEWSRA